MPDDVSQTSTTEQETGIGEHITDDDPLNSRHRDGKGSSNGGEGDIDRGIQRSGCNSETDYERGKPAITARRYVATHPGCGAPHAPHALRVPAAERLAGTPPRPEVVGRRVTPVGWDVAQAALTQGSASTFAVYAALNALPGFGGSPAVPRR